MRAMSECAKWNSCSLKGGAGVFDAAFASHGRDGGGEEARGESGNAQRMGRVFGKWPHSCVLPLLFFFNFLRLEPKMASKQGQHHLA